MSSPNRLYFDGAYDPMTQVGRYGYLIVVSHKTETGYSSEHKIHKNGTILGSCTNNVAEYTGLLEGLSTCVDEHLIEGLDVYGDSQLVIKQMLGDYQVKSDNLKELHDKCVAEAASFKKITWNWIPRKENKVADGLSHGPWFDGDKPHIFEPDYKAMWTELCEYLDADKDGDPEADCVVDSILQKMEELEKKHSSK